MVCNLSGGRIYKGSIAQIDVFLYSPCIEASGVVANFYTVTGTSIEKSDMSISGGIGTVVFQPVELEALQDGLLRYNVSYEVDGEPYQYDYETRYFIKTPMPYTPIDYVTSDELEQSVVDAITSDTVVSEIQTQVEQSISGKADTSAVTQALATKQDQLVSGTNIKTINSQSILGEGNIEITSATATEYSAGTNIDIVNHVISVTGITIPDVSNFVTSGEVQTQIINSISGKQDTLISGTNIKTINNQDILGEGNITIEGGGTGVTYSAGTNIDITDNVISVTGISVPTSNTAFTNDAGYITSQDIPTSNTAFTNDAGYITGVSIPTSNTAFTNDANYVNSGQVQTQINNSISGLSPYTAGTNIQIADNVISVTGITSYTGITSQEVINALGYTPCKVTAMTQTQYSQLETKDANTIYGITGA